MKKTITAILAASLLLLSTGCSARTPDTEELPDTSVSAAPSLTAAASPSPKADSISPSANIFNSADIQGSIREIFYGNGDFIVVLAEQLCLYDTQSGNVTAAVSYPLDSYSKIQPIQGGFAAIGRLSSDSSSGDRMSGDENSFFCIFYDEALKETSRIYLNELIAKDDFIIDVENIAVSTDGRQIAIASINALSLYNTDSKSLQTLLDFSRELVFHDLTLLLIQQIAFVSGNSQLAFLGDSIAEGQQDSITTYGTIRTDGSEFYNFSNSNYSIGESLLALDHLLVLPENFMKASGKLLTYTIDTKEEHLYPLTVPREGRDGVYLSAQGDYFATAQLKETSLILRIYERSSGKLLHEETVSDTEALYFARIPHILLLDNSKTCIVLLGARQEGLTPRTVYFRFSEEVV